MPATQKTLDLPIRKTRQCRNKTKDLQSTSDTTKSPASNTQRRTRSNAKSKDTSTINAENIQRDTQLERTPTKRRILQECDQENICSPPKTSPSQQHLKNEDSPKLSVKKGSQKTEPHDQERKQNEHQVLSPIKLNTLESLNDTTGVVTRSRSPFKSPLKSGMMTSCNDVLHSPAGDRNRHPSQSPARGLTPSKSVILRRLDLSSPSKSPLKRLDFGSPTRTSQRCVAELTSPSKSLSRLNMEPFETSVTKSPQIQRLDFGSPRRSPRKLALEESSPRRSPRKLPMSPRKFDSPSSLVSNLSLSSPSTSKKNVAIGLFKPNVAVYRAMRQSLNTGTPTTLVCRDEQIDTMRDFLCKHLKAGKPGSLYVSGAPGTGKTASLHYLLDEMKENQRKKVFLNCMTLKTSASIYGKIVTELGLPLKATEKENIKLIEKTIVSSKHPMLIVLDEIDQLDSKNQEVLYSIFEWPSLKQSKLVLVGIANALDLTDRVLPRLQARPTFKPQLLHFPPYSKQEIVKIINQRIQEAGLDGAQVIRPTAVQFLAGKVAAVAGDVRKALDVCRRAVELCEIQARRQSVLAPSSSPRKSPRKSPQKSGLNLKMVEIPQVMAIFNEVYGSRVISAVQNAPDSFSLQQKLLICCLLLFLKHAKSKDVTLGKFHEVYTRICRKRNIPDVDQSEFLSLCTLLESRGMLQVKKAKEIRSSKVILRLNPEEAERALGDRTLLAGVLEDKESLGKLCRT